MATITSFLLATAVEAKEKVTVTWPFTPASTQGQYVRSIVDQANKDQDKYEFVFENKLGAGGAIAAQWVVSQRGARLLASSPAFYVRPYLYPDTPYSFDQFKPVMVMSFAPAAMVTKGKTLDQLLAQKRINVATAGAGSYLHLLAEVFFKPYKEGRDIVMVHYKDSNEAVKDVIGGQVDVSFEFLGDARARGDLISIVGITGKQKIDNYKFLPGMEELVAMFALYAPKDISDSQIKELQQILLTAEKNELTQALYRRDLGGKDSVYSVPGDLSNWYERTIKQFERHTKGISIKN